MRNYKFRLYPTKQQEQGLQNALSASRWLYNYFISKNIHTVEDMQFALTELKEREPWLRGYHSKMLQMVIHKIHAGRKSGIALERNGHKVGKLGYASEIDYSSFTYNQSGFEIEKHGKTDLLWLSKIGYIEIRLHRLVDNIKQITILRSINRWYAIICCENIKPIFKFINPMRSIGIDVGITKFSHDSNNRVIENPLFLKKMLKPLKRASRRLSRRQKGSIRRRVARTKLQELHRRVHNKRHDFLHKTSINYARKYDIIFLERLKVLNMVKNRHLARGILDNSWSTFKRMLQYKAKSVILVLPNNTSIDCSRCNNKVPKSLAVRIHRCDRCGLMLDRDHNASLNIKQRGLKLLMGHEEVTPVEILSESVKQEQPIGQRWSVHVY